MTRRRVIYYNDARHNYLFVFEPPMTLEDAWRPVDECAGTGVDTFVYGVERSDGLFHPSKVGMRFGEDMQPFEQSAYWRVWHNMQSLMDRDLDPLTVLIDRAHEKRMDFFASVRLVPYGGMPDKLRVGSGGRGYMHSEVRDHVYAVLEELATQYATDGLELDFAFSGGVPAYFRNDDVGEGTPIMSEWVRGVSTVVRQRDQGPGQVGARIYPTEAMNLASGLDVRTWLEEGLIDYVTPMLYGYPFIDTHLPIDWLVEAAHGAGASVYPMIQPITKASAPGVPGAGSYQYATAAMMRAAAANYWHRGADGMYTQSLKWPLGDEQRRIQTRRSPTRTSSKKATSTTSSPARQTGRMRLDTRRCCPSRSRRRTPVQGTESHSTWRTTSRVRRTASARCC